MTHPKLKKITLSFTIAGIIYIIIGLGCLAFSLGAYTTDLFIFFALAGIGIISLAGGIFNFMVNRGLQNKKRWAWIAAIILSCMYLTSIFLPLGVIALIGLFDEDVRKNYL